MRTEFDELDEQIRKEKNIHKRLELRLKKINLIVEKLIE